MPIENGKNHVLSNEHHIVDKNNGNPQNREVVLLQKTVAIMGSLKFVRICVEWCIGLHLDLVLVEGFVLESNSYNLCLIYKGTG